VNVISLLPNRDDLKNAIFGLFISRTNILNCNTEQYTVGYLCSLLRWHQLQTRAQNLTTLRFRQAYCSGQRSQTFFGKVSVTMTQRPRSEAWKRTPETDCHFDIGHQHAVESCLSVKSIIKERFERFLHALGVHHVLKSTDVSFDILFSFLEWYCRSNDCVQGNKLFFLEECRKVCFAVGRWRYDPNEQSRWTNRWRFSWRWPKLSSQLTQPAAAVGSTAAVAFEIAYCVPFDTNFTQNFQGSHQPTNMARIHQETIPSRSKQSIIFWR